MSHFAGFLRRSDADSESFGSVDREIRRRTLLALSRNTTLKAEQRQDSRFWIAAVAVPTWSASIIVEQRGHGLGAVAGDPLFVEAEETPQIRNSVAKVFEALCAANIGKLAQTRVAGVNYPGRPATTILAGGGGEFLVSVVEVDDAVVDLLTKK